MTDPAREALRQRIMSAFRQPIDRPLTDAAFNELALAVFAWQFERNQPYAAFCRNRGRTPAGIEHWSEVPAVPTEAFKRVALVAGDRESAQAEFRTSGTTHGVQQRGSHHVLDLSLYHSALLPSFAAYLLPDQAAPVMLSLMPPPDQLPDSSLAHMIGTVIDRLGAAGSGWFASVTGGLDHAGLTTALESCRQEQRPVCLLGTTLAFGHWLTGLEQRGERLHLPDGSRLMDTGGYKGRNGIASPAAVLDRYHHRLGLPPEHCINEYGMTELCSQYYDAMLRDRVLCRARPAGMKLPPPWLKCRVVNPETLAPVPEGREGLLQHFDLANLDSVMAVQTEDVGRQSADGLRLLGRVLGAPPRGCSIAMDDLLRAARGRPGEP